ncbi:lytic transglycosylase domain-containing protein [Veillonella montpellierensis]|uniref:lytic transglycosylase domain-containing protein n=1 Tax=Veillonella montpellierensis TaxID=187328 RepID=UPI0023F6F8B5|nr:lytic transglycosylase domain-containing protein [Veillonella montpellierensis]
MRGNTFLAWVIIIMSIGYFVHIEPYMARHYAYPFMYRDVVEQEAIENHVPASLIAGIILAESKFKEEATSDRGAVGLMQLMPDTALWIGKELNQSELSENDIKNPKVNIKLGTWYIAHLLEEYHDNEILALAAYNAGRGHVDDWMKENGWDYEFSNIRDIPFPETRKYVEMVLAYQKQYEVLYPLERN